MGTSKEHALITHLCNPAFRDKSSCLVFPGQAKGDRLSMIYRQDPGDWRDISVIVRTSVIFRTAWFPDANVAILEEARPVWDALRIAGLESAACSTLFTGVVRGELKEWLERPWHNKDRANAIQSALYKRTWAGKFGLEENSPILPAVFGYMRLFGLRRYLTRGTADGLTLLGTKPEEKRETMNAINKNIGRRAQRLAKKGRIDSENNREININDELHCLMAICHSLLTGRETVILTADEDILEIFYKAQWFFDTHYRAFLAAPLVKAGEFGSPVQVLDDSLGYFDRPITLYRRQTNNLGEVLPRIYKSVPVSVIYLAPDKMIHKLGFQFERRMLDMLEMRSMTNGRCTYLFGQDNIHVDLGPIKMGLDGLYLGIGHDAGDWAQTNNTNAFLARLDQEHAMNCREGFSIRSPLFN